MNILLTGYTGNLGPEIARRLAGHRVLALVREPTKAPRIPEVELVPGSLESLPLQLAGEVNVIVHAAACTSFRLPQETLHNVNVEGTRRLLEFARRCPKLQRFVHLSTTCVCGDREGIVAEARIGETPAFVNFYERSKWEAEALVLDSGLPIKIARLSIVAGSESDGLVRRTGALHHTLYWLFKGLIPMMPGRPESTVDLISTEFAAAAVATLVSEHSDADQIVHVSSGGRAPRLIKLLDFLNEVFSARHRGWAAGAFVTPDIVDAGTFALFEKSVHESGDLLFQRVCSDAQSFLPSLLSPHTMATSFVSRFPLPCWRSLAERVFEWLLANDWGRCSKTPFLTHD
jgi:nucleoside-diphosphate-sugar epimerase